MYCGEDCVETFIEHIEDEIKRLCATFSQEPMTELTDVLKTEHKTAEKCHISLKEFDNPENRRVKKSLPLQGFI